MGYSKYVGRIGTLAVALGIGTVVANPLGETPTNDTETSSKPTDAGRQPTTKRPRRSRQQVTARRARQGSRKRRRRGVARRNRRQERGADRRTGDELTGDQLTGDQLTGDELTGDDEVDDPPRYSPPMVPRPAPHNTVLEPPTGTTDVPEVATGLTEPITTPEIIATRRLRRHTHRFELRTDRIATPVGAALVADEPDPGAISLAGPAAIEVSSASGGDYPDHPYPAPIVNIDPTTSLTSFSRSGRPSSTSPPQPSHAAGAIHHTQLRRPRRISLIWAAVEFVRREVSRAYLNSSPTAIADTTTTSEELPVRIAVLDMTPTPISGAATS
jgi:hypothetical protein